MPESPLLADNLETAMEIQADVFARGQQAGSCAAATRMVLARLFSGLVAAYQSLDPAVMSDDADPAERLPLADLHDMIDRAFRRTDRAAGSIDLNRVQSRAILIASLARPQGDIGMEREHRASPTRPSPACAPASACPSRTRSPPHYRRPDVDAFRHVANAYGDDNPLWSDPDYAAGTRWDGPDRPAAAGRRRHARSARTR